MDKAGQHHSAVTPSSCPDCLHLLFLVATPASTLMLHTVGARIPHWKQLDDASHGIQLHLYNDVGPINGYDLIDDGGLCKQVV